MWLRVNCWAKTAYKGVVRPIFDISYSKCEVSSDSDLCNQNVGSILSHIYAAYTFSVNISAVTNEAWQWEMHRKAGIAFLDDFDLLWNYVGTRLTHSLAGKF